MACGHTRGLIDLISSRFHGFQNIFAIVPYPLKYCNSSHTNKITMTPSKKHIGIMAIVVAVTIAPVFAQSALATTTTNTKVRAFQNGLQIEASNPGLINTDTDCVGGIDSVGSTHMICYLIPPGVSNSDNSNAIAQLQTGDEITCPDGVGFDAGQVCYEVTFGAALFDVQGDWHFHAEFYNSADDVLTEGELIADGNQTFQNHSFFVLPESPIGVAALIVSSLAVLGGFMFLRRRSHANLPI